MRDTIDMAREAGLLTHIPFRSDTEVSVALKAFEALVRADERDRAMRENAYVQAEREACAKTKAGKPRELKAVGCGTLLDEQQFCFDKGWREGAAAVRAAIRARGNT